MLQEGQQTIPFNKVVNPNINWGKINHRLLDQDFLTARRGDFWAKSSAPLLLFSSVIDSQGGYSKILGYSHVDRRNHLRKPDDLLEIYNPFLNQALGLYVTRDGNTTFALRDERAKATSHHYEAPKVPSTNTKLGDAELMATFLKRFINQSESNAQVDGPTDEEPYVVMTTPHVTKIGDYGNGKEIIGLIFRPRVQGNNRAVHGDAQLLVRDKIVAKV